MIVRDITLSENSIHIQCIGKEAIESWNLQTKSIPEVVNFFIGEKLQTFFLEQEHGIQFYEIHSKIQLPLRGDAFYTSHKKIALVIKTADCIPLFFWSQDFPVIGAIHAGWRGLFQNIVEKICLKVITKFELKHLNFFIGPCIRKERYEIQEDVACLFREKYPESLEKFGNKYLFSIDYVIKKQIKNLPISINIEDSQICSYSNTKFYSHRRGDIGRNLNFIYFT